MSVVMRAGDEGFPVARTRINRHEQLMAHNVLGGVLESCSREPMTGYFRDGRCRTCEEDAGVHTVCVEVSQAFLEYSAARGNDLSTPRPQWNFPGLLPGDHWCLCAGRWKEAYEAGVAPPVNLAATAHETLKIVPLDWLLEHAETGMPV